VHTQADLEKYLREVITDTDGMTGVAVTKDSPILLDRFLNDAIEVDVDAVSDGERVVIGGIMEHIEQAGVHSGDSACSLPPFSLPAALQDELRRQTVAMARALGVVGLMNVQFAIQGDVVYVLEVNPRASRTVPYVAKATGRQLAKVAARCMVGQSLPSQGVTGEIVPPHFAVKEAVFPFIKFPGVDPILGPEMKSTGEVMGLDTNFARAFAKAQLGAGVKLPLSGTAFVSVKDADKPAILPVARRLAELGFSIMATGGTAKCLAEAGIPVKRVNKVLEGRPHCVDAIRSNDVQLIINTASGAQSVSDSFDIRRSALTHGVPNFTTIAGARAGAHAIAALIAGTLEVAPLQSYFHKSF
ncbi:MAG: ATP-grasp domain-containing protein, partial [Betaproteobacteria bacterium]|nr:ATP-grasp domain-containing protein [Betaproteobacteria bacterium]